MEPTDRSDRLFKPYGNEVYRIAQRIERGQTISAAEVKALPGGVNARYGEEITLLFHALGSRNVEAIDTLLGAGADPYMIDRPSTGSERSFVYYLTLPGHRQIRTLVSPSSTNSSNFISSMVVIPTAVWTGQTGNP